MGLGIFEYFSQSEAVSFIRHALRLVKPGGVLIISNMLNTSPQIAFLIALCRLANDLSTNDYLS